MDLAFFNKINTEISSKFSLLHSIRQGQLNIGGVNRFDSTKINDKAVWVCVNEINYKGNVSYTAVFGSWRTGIQYTVNSWEYGENNSKEFKQHLKTAVKDSQEKLEKEKQEKYEACRNKWAPIFYGLPENNYVHQYLNNKKIENNYLARIDHKGTLIVPAWNAKGIFVGGQRIFLDPVTNKFEKRYTFGIEKKGSFCPFGDIRNAEFIYIVEGFATAASIYMAFQDQKDIAVICIFDTSNILAGAQALREINPKSYLVFAADKDTHSDPKHNNIGERKARFASNKLSNSIVRVVKFENSSPDNWSDYNDLHQFEGIEQVKNQLETCQSDFIEVIPLGFKEDKRFYFITHLKQIVQFTRADHNPTNFILNAPAKYWGERFGFVINKEGEKTKNPDWKMVIEKLGLASAKMGIFNHSKVRGLGAWQHENDIIVNLGDRLYYKSEFYPLYENGIDNTFLYQANQTVELDFSRALGNSDTLKIVEAFQLLNFKNQSDFIIMLGWIFSAQIFAALPWRPHIWLTGERGCGKSTVLKYINDIIGFSSLIQDSTAAGIKQDIGNSAIPVIYDESEPNSEKDRDKMNEVITLARQSSTRSNYKSLRGSASGNAISYNTNATFCMGSIQLSNMGGADASRFFVIEMENIKNQAPENFVRLENAMAEIIDFSSGLFVRAVNMYSTHIKNIELAKKVIKEKKIEARQADQLAPIIAGYWAFFSTQEMNEQFVLNTIKEMNFEKSNYVESNEINDSESCYEDILGLQIPGRPSNVGQILEQLKYELNQYVFDEQNLFLGLIGLRFFKKDHEGPDRLFISSSSSALRKAMSNFSSFSDFKNILTRHKLFIEKKRCRVSGNSTRGIVMEFSPF